MINIDATDLPRLVQCVASYRMPVYYPDPASGPIVSAVEGNAAHWLATTALTGRGEIVDYIDRKAPNGHYIDMTMAEHVAGYVQSVRARHGKRYVEKPITLQLSPEIVINCRPDVITDEQSDTGAYRYIWIDDFKYGHRLVEAENNWTMIAYAMAFSRWAVQGPESMFYMTIHQPRGFHEDGPVRAAAIGIERLRQLEQWLVAHLSNPAPTLQTGPSCYKCPSQTVCPAYQQSVFSIWDFATDPLPRDMTPAQLSAMKDRTTAALAVLNNYDDALNERISAAIKTGERVPNYQLEPAQGSLEWFDYVTADMLQMMTNQPVANPGKLRTPTQLKTVLGENVINAMAHRPNKGLRLVRRDLQKQARKMFGDN